MRILVKLLFFIFGFSFFSFEQINIPNASPITENFDGMGVGTALPTFWKFSSAGAGTTANYNDAGNLTTANLNTCTGITTGGRYNWGLSAACTDRAVGVMTSGSYANTNSVFTYYSNTSGAVITDLLFTFDLERYRINTTNFSLSFFSSTDGVTWTSRAAGDVASGVFVAGTAAHTFSTPQVVSKSISLTGVNIPNGGSIYFKWVFNTGASNSQGVALDNVVLTATVPSCTIPSEPTIQSSGLTVSNIGQTTLQLDWMRGNGARCLVVAKPSVAITSFPLDGSNYNASSIFGSGSTTGAAQYVVYLNSGNSAVITGLTPNTSYYFEVYELNESGPCTNYLGNNSCSGNGTTLAAASYNFYRGNIHSHTAYSDGDLDGVCPNFGSAATCCYTIANSALYFDFMGIADHNHNEGPVMTIAKYQSGLTEASNYNVANAGTFAALYGMEWGSISTGGHACVYGIESLVGWNAGNYEVFVAKGDYDALFNLVSNTANAFAYLAHPNSTDYGGIFSNPYNAIYDNAVIGVSLENGPYNSTNITYADPATATPDEARYKDLLKIGYHVGPGIDLDNHNSNTMGRCSQGRTVVLASSLSKSTVVDAYRNRRFYATEDYNTDVYYTINSTILMGSITSGSSNPYISVSITDPDVAESITSIEVYYGVPGSGVAATVLTSNTLSSTLTYTHVIGSGTTYYYYIKIVQADGHRIWTAPIWYSMSTPLGIELLDFDAKLVEGTYVQIDWKTISEKNNDNFYIQKTRDGINFETIEIVKGQLSSSELKKYSVNDFNPYPGQSYYRLRQIDLDGTEYLSNLKVINIANVGNGNLWLYPNPSKNEINIVSKINTKEFKVHIQLLNILGEIVYEEDFEKGNQGEFKLNLTTLEKGIYVVNVQFEDWKFSEKVIKF